MSEQDDELKLYSLNKARQLLGIGRATLQQYINDGLLGVIPQGKSRLKISKKELQRFLEVNTLRNRKITSVTHTDKREITNLICGGKNKIKSNFNSVELFENIMEKNING